MRNPGWARALLAANPNARLEPETPLRWWRWTPLVVLVMALAHQLQMALWVDLRLLNLSDNTLQVWVDDRLVATLAPSSAESPVAGALVRVPAGRRRLAFATPAAPLWSADRQLTPSVQHLLVHGHERRLADGHPRCFWLELTGYGRVSATSTRVPLSVDGPLLALPRRVDSWFAPSPPAQASRWFSGGRHVALRHGRCSRSTP